MRVVVIGAGIIGTTSALRIKHAYPDSQLTIVAEHLSPNTTSDLAIAGYIYAAAGIVMDDCFCSNLPLRLKCCGGEQERQENTKNAYVWVRETYQMCLQVWRGEPVPELVGIQDEVRECVSMISCLEVDSDRESDDEDLKAWNESQVGYTRFTNTETVTKLGFSNPETIKVVESSYSFLLDMRQLLPLLYQHLRQLGVSIEERKMESFSDVADDCDIIINCTGLGSQTLRGVDDLRLYAIAGHFLRMKFPKVDMRLIDHRRTGDYYRTAITPTKSGSLLGMANSFSVDTQPSSENRERILKSCQAIIPSIREEDIQEEVVGLRPVRRGGPRVALETWHGVKVIHNYGHGGSGISMSWGCAGKVLSILEAVLNPEKSKTEAEERKSRPRTRKTRTGKKERKVL